MARPQAAQGVRLSVAIFLVAPFCHPEFIEGSHHIHHTKLIEGTPPQKGYTLLSFAHLPTGICRSVENFHICQWRQIVFIFYFCRQEHFYKANKTWKIYLQID
jgi:hypothetical protein